MTGLTSGLWILCAILAGLSYKCLDCIAMPGQLMRGEYCQLETFVATCEENEVIIMESANYGRMRMGRCVQGNMGYVGCSVDVIDIADRKCSGRQRCEIRIPDEDLESREACYTELKLYLDASYRCVPVQMKDEVTCNSCSIVDITEPSGFIASVFTDTSGCGSSLCPWRINGLPGQIVNITLLDFTYDDANYEGGVHVGSARCSHVMEYVFIREADVTKSVNICPGASREHLIYTSSGNQVELSLISSLRRKNNGYFVVHFEVLGCQDMALTKEMWFKRNSDRRTAVVGCSDTPSEKWKITCLDQTWVGDIGNCSSASYETGTAEIVWGSLTLSYGTAIVIIVLVALAVGVVILTLGLVAWRWHKHTSPREVEEENHYTIKPITSPMRGKYQGASATACYVDRGDLANYSAPRIYRTDSNNYTHVWEMPLPVPDGCEACEGSLITRGSYIYTCKCANPEHSEVPPDVAPLDRCSGSRTDLFDNKRDVTAKYFELEPQV